MNARTWLVVTVASLAGCSVHSLEYLERGDQAVGAGGLAAIAGASGSAAAGMPTGTSGGGTSFAGAGGAAAGGDGPAARCDDGLLNGDEADVDCGGRACAPCPPGKRCLMGTDCSSAICTNQSCQPPSCNDLARNGDETDFNCGGQCAPCVAGYACQFGADCSTGLCTNALCAIPSCDGPTPDAACPPLVDNTAYTLRPADAPASCVDIVAMAVADGAQLQQYTCHGGINQTFWALAAPGGYFSLRSALSGKCVQVRGNSLASGALIEQATCTGQSNQLFAVSRDSAGLKLVIQWSGLSLDVSGAESVSDGERLVQSTDDGSMDMRWTAVKSDNAGLLTLTALGQTGVVLHHVGTEVRAEASSGADSQWKVEPGLAAPACVSFEASDRPGAYLRHANSLLWTDTSDGSASFREDATFCLRSPLSGSDYSYRSLQSFNYPSNYVSASDGRVRLLTLESTSAFQELATWVAGPTATPSEIQ